eukprot:403377084
MVLKFLSYILLKCATFSQVDNSDIDLVFLKLPSYYEPFESLSYLRNVDSDHYQSHPQQYYTFLPHFTKPIPDKKRQLNFYQNFGINTLVFFYDSNYYRENQISEMVEDAQNQIELNLQKIDFNVYFGHVMTDLTSNQKNEFKTLVDSYREGKLRTQDQFNGTLRNIDNDEIIEMLDLFKDWRKSSLATTQYRLGQALSFNPVVVLTNQLPPKADYVLLMHSFEEPSCFKYHDFISKLSKYLDKIPALVVAVSDTTQLLFNGRSDVGIPQLVYYKKDKHNQPIRIKEPLSIDRYSHFLKENSISYKYHVNLMINQRAIFKQKEWYVFQNYCAPIYNSPEYMTKVVRFQNLDYDYAVDYDLTHRVDLIGYRITPFTSYKGRNLGPQFSQIVRFDAQSTPVKVVVINGPLISAQDRKHYWDLVYDGYMPLGLMSLMSYPMYDEFEASFDQRITFAKDFQMREIIKTFAGWLHVVKQPSTYLGNNHPRLLMNAADSQYYYTQGLLPSNFTEIKKDIDLLYVLPDEDLESVEWHMKNKNWSLALKCFEKITAQTKYKIVTVGKTLPKNLKGKVLRKKNMEGEELMTLISRAKIVFIPHVHDASPNILARALTANTAVLVNKDIIGGWHLVNHQSGGFFTNENDVIKEMKSLISRWKTGELSPRQWYTDFYQQVPKRLQSFVEMLRWENKYPFDDNYYMD